MTFLLCGERPLRTELRKGWQWKHGRLAAKTLHEALRAAGIDPQAQEHQWLGVSRISQEHEQRIAFFRSASVRTILPALGAPGASRGAGLF
jgi:hypothetical protein